VVTFRDMADVTSISQAAGRGSRVVVIGGGLLGIEAACGLAKIGAAVTLVHLTDRLMERQLDARAASMLKRVVEARGISVLLNATTKRFIGDDRVEALELEDGRTLEAELAVVAVGIRPNAELAAAAGVAVNRGIIVDDRLQTNVVDVFAIGECAEHCGVCYGLVAPANEHAHVLAERLAGRDIRYGGSVNATNLKVSGVQVFSAGDFIGASGSESIVLADAGLDRYRKLVIEDGRLVGAVLYGDTADAQWYLEFIRSGASIELIREDLVFGRSFVECSPNMSRTSAPADHAGTAFPRAYNPASVTAAIGVAAE
jgi:nitrite reductase (NADH) large subunit